MWVIYLFLYFSDLFCILWSLTHLPLEHLFLMFHLDASADEIPFSGGIGIPFSTCSKYSLFTFLIESFQNSAISCAKFTTVDISTVDALRMTPALSFVLVSILFPLGKVRLTVAEVGLPQQG